MPARSTSSEAVAGQWKLFSGISSRGLSLGCDGGDLADQGNVHTFDVRLFYPNSLHLVSLALSAFPTRLHGLGVSCDSGFFCAFRRHRRCFPLGKSGYPIGWT